jgi:hypothetical protein
MSKCWEAFGIKTVHSGPLPLPLAFRTVINLILTTACEVGGVTDEETKAQRGSVLL